MGSRVAVVVFLLLPVSHGVIAWAMFLVLNLYVDAVFFWPWLPAKIRVAFGEPIFVNSGAAEEQRRKDLEEGHRRIRPPR